MQGEHDWAESLALMLKKWEVGVKPGKQWNGTSDEIL